MAIPGTRMRNAENGLITDAKLADYVLNVDHPRGGPKAKFFASHGFDLTDMDDLRSALIEHASSNDVESHRSTAYGIVYEIFGPLQTPVGRMPTVRVVWSILYGEDRPRLVTVVPKRKRR